MGLELWAPVATIFGLVVAVGTLVWRKIEKFDDRLRNVEIEVARLDERTRRPVANTEAGDGTFEATWGGLEE